MGSKVGSLVGEYDDGLRFGFWDLLLRDGLRVGLGVGFNVGFGVSTSCVGGVVGRVVGLGVGGGYVQQSSNSFASRRQEVKSMDNLDSS